MDGGVGWEGENEEGGEKEDEEEEEEDDEEAKGRTRGLRRGRWWWKNWIVGCWEKEGRKIGVGEGGGGG